MTGLGQGDVEDQHRPRFDIDHPGWWLPELYGAFAAQELGSGLVHEPNADRVDSDLGAPAANPKHQVGAGIYRGKVGEPDVLKHAEHAELALLIDQGVVGDDCEIEVQGSADSNGRDDVVLLDLVHYIHALGNLTENRVNLVQMRLG